jgi:hypothetical protein
MELYLHSPYTSLWCGVWLSNERVFMARHLVKHTDKFTFTLPTSPSSWIGYSSCAYLVLLHTSFIRMYHVSSSSLYAVLCILCTKGKQWVSVSLCPCSCRFPLQHFNDFQWKLAAGTHTKSCLLNLILVHSTTTIMTTTTTMTMTTMMMMMMIIIIIIIILQGIGHSWPVLVHNFNFWTYEPIWTFGRTP